MPEEEQQEEQEEGPEGYMQEGREDGEYIPEQINPNDLRPVSSSNSSNTDTLAEGTPSGDMDELPPMKSPKRKRNTSSSTTSSSTTSSSTTSSSTTRSQRPKKKSKTSSPNKSAFTFRDLSDEKNIFNKL